MSSRQSRSAFGPGLLAIVLATLCSTAACGGGDEETAPEGPAGHSGSDAAGTGGGMTGMASPDEQDPDYSYSACSTPERVGGFAVTLVPEATINELVVPEHTTVDGKVSDGVDPNFVPEVLMTEGDCTLLRGRNLFCEDDCGGGMICGQDGECVAAPVGQDVGTVEITGLQAAVSMQARAPSFNYTFTDTIDYPGVDEGAAVALSATGGGQQAFALFAEGIAPFQLEQQQIPVQSGSPVTLSWMPPARAGRSRVLATLNISLHGGDPVRIECDSADDGSLEIPAALITELLTYTYSGFPALDITRQTADSTRLSLGCVDFRVRSQNARVPVEIPGLTSCNTDRECPMGQLCDRSALRCI